MSKMLCMNIDILVYKNWKNTWPIKVLGSLISVSFYFNVKQYFLGDIFIGLKNISFKLENICNKRNPSLSQILKLELSNWNRNIKVILSLIYSDVVKSSFKCYNGNRRLNLLNGI